MDSQDRAQVTPEMYQHWLYHPVTQRFKAEMEETRQRIVDQAIDFNRPCDVENTAKIKGMICGLDFAVTWTVE